MHTTLAAMCAILFSLIGLSIARGSSLDGWKGLQNTKESTECKNATTIIRDAADASSLASCKTYTGVVTVATVSAEVIELRGVEAIVGSLVVVDNSGLTTIASSSIVSVTDQVQLANLRQLTNITFPMVWLPTQ